MKLNTKPVIGAVALLTAAATLAQMDPTQQTPIPPDQLPRSATYWLASGLGGLSAPLPCPPADTNVPVYALPNGQFLALDSGGVDGAPAQQQAMNAALALTWLSSPMLLSEEGGLDGPN